MKMGEDHVILSSPVLALLVPQQFIVLRGHVKYDL